MTRGTWVFDEKSGELVPKDEYRSRAPAPKRSHLPSPQFIRDCIEVTSMVDGKTYTSKSALRKSYRAGGYVEVGNEELKSPPRPKPDREGIRNAVRRAASQVGLPTV